MDRKIIALALCVCMALCLLSGCGTAVDDVQASSENAVETMTYAADTAIAFSASNVKISGSGAEIADDGDVKITASGVYAITGASDSARVVVETADTDEVTVILAGCELTCPDDEVIYFKVAGSAVVILEEGTENTLISGAASSDISDEEDEDASGAALRAKCDMTVTGGGALTVYGYINNGVASSEDLTISGGSITVTAVNDAVKAGGALTVQDGVLTLSAEHDGMQSGGDMTVTGGTISLLTGTGAEGADMKVSDSSMMGNFGNARNRAASTEAEDASESETEQVQPDETSGEMSGFLPWDMDDSDTGSHKGLKSDSGIRISGGTIALDTEDDAIHADGDVIITDGTLDIASGDDGVHADGSLTISGGSVMISLCYEGLEATNVLIEGGVIDITATDDGMNVNGGDFGMMMRGFASGEASGSDEADEDSEPAVLRITGGTVLVDSGGDGLDSNGNIYIEGGVIYVSGPSSDWDAAIDYGDGGYELIITGGVLMAGGYSGMAESPDSAEGSQCTIYYMADEYCSDGDTAALIDADGNVLMEFSFAHGFNCVVLSSPELTVGETYTLVMGSQTVEIELTSENYSNRTGGMGGIMGGGRRASGEASA